MIIKQVGTEVQQLQRNEPADTNKDGSVDYREGWLDIETSYCDSVIKCYNDYRTNDSESMIANYEQKR